MAFDQGWATYAPLTNIVGGKFTMSRGVRPSTAVVRCAPTSPLIHGSYPFSLFYGVDTAVVIPKCAVGGVHNRKWTDREGWKQEVMVLDRRWRWQFVHIDGVYNLRALNGEIQARDKKTLRELIELLLEALGETNAVTADVPNDVYPPCVWRHARADVELQWLCDLASLCVCPQWSMNRFAIKKLNDTAGMELPSAFPATPLYESKVSVIPEELRVQGGDTIFQTKLTLEAVALDTDGKIIDLADVSYKPVSGWTTQWYDSFQGVAAADRHLAFRSVWRWFRPSAGWSEADSCDDIELLDTCAECGEDQDGVLNPVAPVVQGTFWPLGDKNENTGEDTIYAGNFRVIPGVNVIEFEHPVIQWSASLPVAPTLYVTIAYKVRKNAGEEVGDSAYVCYTKDAGVSQAKDSTEPRVLSHPELFEVQIDDSVIDGLTGSNSATLDAEADVYLNRGTDSYAFPYQQEMVFNGLLAQDLDGAIAQVEWTWGNGDVATTRIGRYTEVDPYSMKVNQQRALARLKQMMERQNL